MMSGNSVLVTLLRGKGVPLSIFWRRAKLHGDNKAIGVTCVMKWHRKGIECLLHIRPNARKLMVFLSLHHIKRLFEMDKCHWIRIIHRLQFIRPKCQRHKQIKRFNVFSLINWCSARFLYWLIAMWWKSTFRERQPCVIYYMKYGRT